MQNQGRHLHAARGIVNIIIFKIVFIAVVIMPPLMNQRFRNQTATMPRQEMDHQRWSRMMITVLFSALIMEPHHTFCSPSIPKTTNLIEIFNKVKLASPKPFISRIFQVFSPKKDKHILPLWFSHHFCWAFLSLRHPGSFRALGWRGFRVDEFLCDFPSWHPFDQLQGQDGGMGRWL